MISQRCGRRRAAWLRTPSRPACGLIQTLTKLSTKADRKLERLVEKMAEDVAACERNEQQLREHCKEARAAHPTPRRAAPRRAATAAAPAAARSSSSASLS